MSFDETVIILLIIALGFSVKDTPGGTKLIASLLAIVVVIYAISKMFPTPLL